MQGGKRRDPERGSEAAAVSPVTCGQRWVCPGISSASRPAGTGVVRANGCSTARVHHVASAERRSSREHQSTCRRRHQRRAQPDQRQREGLFGSVTKRLEHDHEQRFPEADAAKGDRQHRGDQSQRDADIDTQHQSGAGLGHHHRQNRKADQLVEQRPPQRLQRVRRFWPSGPANDSVNADNQLAVRGDSRARSRAASRGDLGSTQAAPAIVAIAIAIGIISSTAAESTTARATPKSPSSASAVSPSTRSKATAAQTHAESLARGRWHASPAPRRRRWSSAAASCTWYRPGRRRAAG